MCEFFSSDRCVWGCHHFSLVSSQKEPFFPYCFLGRWKWARVPTVAAMQMVSTLFCHLKQEASFHVTQLLSGRRFWRGQLRWADPLSFSLALALTSFAWSFPGCSYASHSTRGEILIPSAPSPMPASMQKLAMGFSYFGSGQSWYDTGHLSGE